VPQLIAVCVFDNPPNPASSDCVLNLNPLAAQTTVAFFLGLGQFTALGLFDWYAQIV
jgi:hypothetical protein